MSNQWVRAGAALAAAIILIAAYEKPNQPSQMTDAANAFLNSLFPDQKKIVSYTFDDDERFDWHFIPKERKGLSLGAMQNYQRNLAIALIATGLSQQGLIKAETIMSLDQVLFVMEGGPSQFRRDPDNYYITIFGTPSATGSWGFRLEGHHVAQNFTIVNGKVAGSPSFFGSNPGEVREGNRKGLKILKAEDEVGYDMIESLDAQQRAAAIVDPRAYNEIVTSNSRKAALDGKPSGLQASKMTDAQYKLLMTLIEVYASNMASPLDQARMDLARKQPRENTWFAWTGGVPRGVAHYYRVQTPAFLIEFDDTQNNANHIHTVWRDFEGDFGMDLLKAHYDASHKP
jgi:hypothetical protein